MDQILRDFVESQMKNESDEVKIAVFKLSLLLAIEGVELDKVTGRALEIIGSYALFLDGVNKKK